MTARILHGDCIAIMAAMPDESVDAIVTDPPYGLGFMGKAWDELPPGEDWARECLRVLKPGGHLVAFGGTRTWHRLAVAVEDAGFEMRDSLAWLYGSGFPKSLDVSKAIDKAAGALEHEGRGFTVAGRTDKNLPNPVVKGYVPPAPTTPAAQQWNGWGTALKPAFEPVVLARKPLVGTVAANVLEHGTGALNIDGCRIEGTAQAFGNGTKRTAGIMGASESRGAWTPTAAGRWPANVLLDQHAAAWVDEQSGHQKDGVAVNRNKNPDIEKPHTVYGRWMNGDRPDITYGGGGGASRFFYTAKASKKERPVVEVPKRRLRLRDDLTPEQVDHVRARLAEAGVRVD